MNFSSIKRRCAAVLGTLALLHLGPLHIGPVPLGWIRVSWSQSRVTDYLRRMDTNGNGRIEPAEISDRARPFLERFVRGTRIRLSESNSVVKLEDAVRAFYARGNSDNGAQNSRDDRAPGFTSPATTQPRVPGFGPDASTPAVPGFGIHADVHYPFTDRDLGSARSLLRRYDVNQDGAIDRDEARQVSWREGNPYRFDYDKDSRLSENELAQRYAKRRLDEARPRPDREREPPEANQRSDNERGDQRDQGSSNDRARRRENNDNPGRNASYLAQSVLGRHDVNRNGRLERREWPALGENVGQADLNGDNQISRDELAMWLFREMDKRADDLADTLPVWFFDLDSNDDSQVSMDEFTQEWTDDKAEEFARHDRDGDGFITSQELLTSREAVGGNYKNQAAQVLLARSTLVSEIEIDDDFLIGDLDVQVSITHTYAAQIDAYLIGPDGQRVELFTAVGGSDDHFDGTVLDDESGNAIGRARPPFRGRYRPESAERDQPSLKHFYGSSTKGLWQLMLRTNRADRAGMLHGWSLTIKPQQ